ncbi:hypothetical protein LVB77_11840 [Lysobacter sp. 5GHs7-4]|uniref:hypothetical protein n=1 Tax=Lysobacter sp. 5GHs7-4 TaxID=2904253 RepID=UPI001E620C61|nr:hypothetical protein [Lysobacter sp. 5GHs7-4]UHQ21381.1 hypothetical protein LVB77_11840 [Lysobacter sp. 5GHs7-4]
MARIAHDDGGLGDEGTAVRFRAPRFWLGLALILAYGTVPLLAGHGMGVVGMMLTQGSLGASLGWLGIVVLLIAAFHRSGWWLVAGPLLLCLSLWLILGEVYGDEIDGIGDVFNLLLWSGLFHVLMIVVVGAAFADLREMRQLEDE